LGENPPLPLIPGVVLTADQLQPGQATILTYDAFVHQASIDIYDSLGNAHNLVMSFKHVGENLWDWTVSLPDEPNLTLTNTSGTIEFGANGLIRTPNPTDPLLFDPMGATSMRVTPSFNGDGELINGVTQFASTSTTSAIDQDGWTMGILQAFAFDTTGVLRGIFSNGLTRPIAQLALALFANPAGLQRSGDNTFVMSGNSGLASVRSPGTGGAGVLIPGALEQSNVDAATEFTELIIAQRSYQANSRVITVQSELLQDVINLIR
jgi:flagellar hook protein FlgE